MRTELQQAIDLLKSLRLKVDIDAVDVIDDFIEKMEQPIAIVDYDQDCESPREWDNADAMFCKHGRYTLGDKDAEDPFEEVQAIKVDGHFLTLEQADNVRQEFEDWVPDDDDEAEQRDATLLALDEDNIVTARRLRSNVAIIFPLALYDHSGITIFHGTRGIGDAAGWDSGQIGWHYMTKDVLEKEWKGDRVAAERYMNGTLEVYDDYIRGNCFWYRIEDHLGNDLDSCGGFIGDTLEANGMLDNVEKKYRKALEAAWEKRFG